MKRKFSESCPIGIVGCGCRVVKTDASSTKHVSSACYYFYPNMMRNLLEIPIVPIRFRLRCLWPLLAFFLSSLAGVRDVGCAQRGPEEASRLRRSKRFYAQGMQALQRGDLPAAETAFNKVLRLAPSSAEAHNSLGWVLQAEEKIEPAIREFQAAINFKPDFPQAHINLANAFLRSGNRAGATSRGKRGCSPVPIRLRGSTHSGTSVRRIRVTCLRQSRKCGMPLRSSQTARSFTMIWARSWCRQGLSTAAYNEFSKALEPRAWLRDRAPASGRAALPR